MNNLGVSLTDIIIGVIIYMGLLLLAGWIYSEIWRKRGEHGHFDNTLRIITRPITLEIKTEISTMRKELKQLKEDLPNTISAGVFRRFNGEKGGVMKGVMAEEKQAMIDLAKIASAEYPNLIKARDELDGLIDAGIVDKEWADSFNRLLRWPRALPQLEQAAKLIYSDKKSIPGMSQGRPKF